MLKVNQLYGFGAGRGSAASAGGNGSGSVVTWITTNGTGKHADIFIDAAFSSSANCTATRTGSSGVGIVAVRATGGINAASGNGYFEIQSRAGTGQFKMFGVAPASEDFSVPNYPGKGAASWAMYQNTGNKYNNDTGSAYGSSWTDSSTRAIGVAVKNGSIWFAIDNVWQNSGNPAANTGAAFTGLTGTIYPAVGLYSTSAQDIAAGRFKTADFAYSPPSGFTAWGI